MDIVEHNTAPPLIDFIDEIKKGNDASWGIVRIKKNHLKSITDQAFLMALRPVLKEADLVHVFFIGNKRIFIVWSGHKKSVYRQLRALIGATLAQPGLDVDPPHMAAYIDPLAKGEDLKAALRVTGDAASRLFERAEDPAASADMDGDDSEFPEIQGSKPELTVTQAQIVQFQEIRGQKSYRKQLNILVVEDQIFSQKLLCEILRSARTRNNNETPLIDTVQGIHEAWKIFLKKAPDLIFVDLGLTDGSGHTLAHAIKELDPASCVVIVTANNDEEELNVARQNNVDGFIAKPYNKKQILDCIDRYVGTLKSQSKGGSRGSACELR